MSSWTFPIRSKVFSKIVPHFDTQDLRQYLHQIMATFSTTGKDVMMVVDRSGIHRAHKLATTFDHDDGKLRFHFLPAHCGHHLNPIEGFWRVLKDCMGAGRCFANLHLLYQRTRQVLMAHQERPIYELKAGLSFSPPVISVVMPAARATGIRRGWTRCTCVSMPPGVAM